MNDKSNKPPLVGMIPRVIEGEPGFGEAGVVRSQEGRGGRPVSEPSPFSPLKYDSKKHADILAERIEKNCPFAGDWILRKEYQATGGMRTSIDDIMEVVEEFQLELVRKSVVAGLGLAAFFPADERRAIQIKRPVRERIEQVILMLGDAFVKRCDEGSKPAQATHAGPVEAGSIDAESCDDEFVWGRKLAHGAQAIYEEEGHAEGAICMLTEAFGLSHVEAALVGMREGDDGWDLEKTWEYAQSQPLSDKEAIHFCLCVWNTAHRWKGFDIVAAFACWSPRKRGAFYGWLDKPWWP